MTTWKVVPICEAQKLDVRPDDLLNRGDFRKCDVSRTMMEDQFPSIVYKRYGKHLSQHFVVQLYGCTLRCFYCYVTLTGVWSMWNPYTTKQLMDAYLGSRQEVFHLMGGSPALYMRDWPELLDNLPSDKFFHSDLLLVEGVYNMDTLRKLASDANKAHSLYAVNIKGATFLDYFRNTGIEINVDLLMANLDKIVEVDLPFYLTFTNPSRRDLPEFLNTLVTRYGKKVLNDCYVIDIVSYKSMSNNSPGVM